MPAAASRAPISLTAAERNSLLALLPAASHCDDADCPLEDPLSALVEATRCCQQTTNTAAGAASRRTAAATR